MSMTVMSEGTTHCAIAMHPCIKWAINLYNLSTKILPNLTASILESVKFTKLIR